MGDCCVPAQSPLAWFHLSGAEWSKTGEWDKSEQRVIGLHAQTVNKHLSTRPLAFLHCRIFTRSVLASYQEAVGHLLHACRQIAPVDFGLKAAWFLNQSYCTNSLLNFTNSVSMIGTSLFFFISLLLTLIIHQLLIQGCTLPSPSDHWDMWPCAPGLSGLRKWMAGSTKFLHTCWLYLIAVV